MSKDAVKFGRMSKKQRAILQAEVQKLLKKRSDMSSETPAEQPSTTTPELPHSTQTSAWMGHSRWDDSFSSRSLPRMQLQRAQLVLHNPEKTPAEAATRKSFSRDQQLHMESVQPNVFHNVDSYCSLVSSCLHPQSMISATELELLMQNVVLAHQETCQFRQENLQMLRWETFTSAEVQGLQQKSMELMWERCVGHVTDAIQYIVEFAKRLSGFMDLNPNDQIVLLKAGAMELLLIRMSRAFNCYNNSVFFEGKYARLEVFHALGCSDLIGAMFQFSQSLCALNLSEHEVAFYSAMTLLNPGRPWLQEKQKVENLYKRIHCAFRHLLRRTHRELIIMKLPEREKFSSISQLHLEKLQVFMQMYPSIAWERFPPLYKELFLSETENS
ncbi:nuclear receptor ROR-gamma-like isoform X2 [Engystomops pustulosus]